MTIEIYICSKNNATAVVTITSKMLKNYVIVITCTYLTWLQTYLYLPAFKAWWCISELPILAFHIHNTMRDSKVKIYICNLNILYNICNKI